MLKENLIALEMRIKWIEAGLGDIADMPTYNILSDVNMALGKIYEILKEMK